MEPSDADLLRAAGRGDAAAFHALVDRHATALFQVAISFSRNRADAEDLVQETLIAAYRGSSGFAGRSAVRTWLVQILARNASRAWRRGRHRRGTLSIDAATAAGGDHHDAALTTPSAAAGVDHRIDTADILQGLSAVHREVLVMREILGLSYDEIARALSVPRGTVESRLSRARAAFRERLEASDRRPERRLDHRGEAGR